MNNLRRIRNLGGDSWLGPFLRPGAVAMLLSGVGVLGFSTSALADPITALFNVTVAERWNLQSGDHEPFSPSFELTLRFDENSTRDTSATQEHRIYSGLPIFSPVPTELVTASRPVGQNTIVVGNVVDQWFLHEGLYHRQATAAINEIGPTYRLTTQLFQPSLRGFSAPPALTTSSFLAYLGAGNTINFLHTGFAFTETETAPIYAPNSYRYEGVARLLRFDIPGGEQPGPVPEPSTLALLGSGLAAGMLRSRRARKQRGASNRPHDGG